jgi:hypothetical protein
VNAFSEDASVVGTRIIVIAGDRFPDDALSFDTDVQGTGVWFLAGIGV